MTKSYSKGAKRTGNYKGGLTGSKILREYKRKPKGFYRSSGIKGGSEAIHGIPSLTQIQLQRNQMTDEQFAVYLQKVVSKIDEYRTTHPQYTHPLDTF